MRKKSNYPVTLSLIIDHPDEAKKVFLDELPHDGAFIGVTKLDGSFLCDSVGELYSSLQQGERLSLLPEEGSAHALPALKAVRADGSFVGVLQYSAAILPNMLMSRGISVWCHLEAAQFNAGMLEIGVSIYCEKY